MVISSTCRLLRSYSYRAMPPILIGVLMTLATSAERTPSGIYDFTVKDIDGKNVSLSRYEGKVLLIVNVASRCGNTPQYADLEELYRRYKEQGFMILGFPANNFRAQEPGTDPEIKKFCTINYNVTFDMFSKISVKGSDQHPLYTFLTSAETNPEYAGDVKWNFQKYLVGRNGNVIAKFMPNVEPLSPDATRALDNALKEHADRHRRDT
jgi:glutathione peroxidase